MIKESTTIDCVLKLKSGAKFNVTVGKDRSFTAQSLTVGTLQTFILSRGGTKMFVQGDQIEYLITEPK